MTTLTLQRRAVLAACADMIRACGLTLAELAQHMGVPHEAAPAPELVKLKKPALSEQAQQVLAYCDQPKGAIMKQVADMLGVDYSTGAHHCEKLARARLLQKVKVPGEHAFRYWTNPVHAQAYVEARTAELQQQKDAEKQAQEQRQREAQDRQRQAAERAAALVRQRQERAASDAAPKPAKKPKPLPHQVLTITPPKIDDSKMRPQGEAIITADTKITRDTAARPTARWQMRQEAPDERWPSFSAARPGIDPATGKARESRT